jgi:hypothetical protein
MIVPANAPQKSPLDEWLSYVLGAGQAFGRSLDYATLALNVLRASDRTAIQFRGSP